MYNYQSVLAHLRLGIHVHVPSNSVTPATACNLSLYENDLVLLLRGDVHSSQNVSQSSGCHGIAFLYTTLSKPMIIYTHVSFIQVVWDRAVPVAGKYLYLRVVYYNVHQRIVRLRLA